MLHELGEPLRAPARHPKSAITLARETTLQALARLANTGGGHLACLNFASAKNPGGGFLGGAQAQEESLARSSALYPCLLEQRDHYERNRAETVGSLLAGGADVNARSNAGWTALMSAAWEGHSAVVKTLLEKGADASLKNSRGETARMLAETAGRADVVRLLAR